MAGNITAGRQGICGGGVPDSPGTTDLAFHAMEQAARSIGCSLGAMVAMERPLFWLFGDSRRGSGPKVQGGKSSDSSILAVYSSPNSGSFKSPTDPVAGPNP